MKQFYRLVTKDKYNNNEIIDALTLYFMDLEEAEKTKKDFKKRNKQGLDNYNFCIYNCYFNDDTTKNNLDTLV